MDPHTGRCTVEVPRVQRRATGHARWENCQVDATSMIAVAIIVAATACVLALAPRIHRDTRRRWEKGVAGGGLCSALDAIWRPSAEDAHAQWEAQVEMPAPAPSPADKGLDDGRIIIELH
jgi:hypothetical protein